jgi:hypothetical protein
MSQLTNFAAEARVDCFRDDCPTGLPVIQADDSAVQAILQLTFGIIGALAVIMILYAGFKLVSSQGNPQEAASARKTMIYALVGLAIALSAEAIVTFVLRGL